MAFMSKDGRKFGSSFVAKRRDAEHAKMGAPESEGEGLMKKAAPTPSMSEPAAPMSGAPEEQKPGMGAPPEDPKQVAAEHGPAEDVHIHHSPGKHHVVSRHKDGHMHTSDHASADEANKAASTLGAGDQPVQGAAPAVGESDNAMFGDNFSTPKLA
jgi:hypothetical protein